MPRPKVVEFQRPSLTSMIAEIQNCALKSKGVIAIWLDDDGNAHFRISGFDAQNDYYIVCGLLDWIKADLLSDIVNA